MDYDFFRSGCCQYLDSEITICNYGLTMIPQFDEGKNRIENEICDAGYHLYLLM